MPQTKLVHHVGIRASEVSNHDIVIAQPPKDLISYFSGTRQPVPSNGSQPDCVTSGHNYLFDDLDGLFVALTFGSSDGCESVPNWANYKAA
jgi:hypothetical protein